MSFIRKIKKGNSTYLVEVESYRKDGKVKQRVIQYLGKEISQGKAEKKVLPSSVEVISSKEYLNYKVVLDIAKQLELDVILGDNYQLILFIIISQLICHKSMYKLPEYHQNTYLKELLNIKEINSKTLYETLSELEEKDFEIIETRLYNKYLEYYKKDDIMLIDVTDTYFNGSASDWKSRRGKDGKYSKLIQIGLATTKQDGFPIFQRIYEGNISNIKIFQDMLAKTKAINSKIVIIDRGMTSKETLDSLMELNQSVICGLRMTSRHKKEILDKISREDIYHPKNKVQLKSTEVFVQAFEYDRGRIIVVYNPLIETSRRSIAMRDENSYNHMEAKYYGYSLIYHTTKEADKEVVKLYFERDKIESSYKELKSNIYLHPIRNYLIRHVKAHIKICYLAYAILCFMDIKTKKINLSAVSALEKLQPAHIVELSIPSEKLCWRKMITLKNEQKEILEALNCSV